MSIGTYFIRCGACETGNSSYVTSDIIGPAIATAVPSSTEAAIPTLSTDAVVPLVAPVHLTESSQLAHFDWLNPAIDLDLYELVNDLQLATLIQYVLQLEWSVPDDRKVPCQI